MQRNFPPERGTRETTQQGSGRSIDNFYEQFRGQEQSESDRNFHRQTQGGSPGGPSRPAADQNFPPVDNFGRHQTPPSGHFGGRQSHHTFEPNASDVRDLSVDQFGREIDQFGIPVSYRPPPQHQPQGEQQQGHRGGPPPPSPGQSPIPVDQYGRFVHPQELGRGQQTQRQPEIVIDQYGRPVYQGRPILDQYGRPIPPELLRRLQLRPEDLARQPPPYHQSMGGRRRLEPQDKGEAPTQRFAQQPRPAMLLPEDNPLAQVPIRMIRGEHREIEEEIANRILSDISEEGSLAGSVASLEELEPFYSVRDYRDQRRRGRYDRSESSTPRLEELSDDETTHSSPTLSPKTIKESENFFASPTPSSPQNVLSPTPSERINGEETDYVKEPESSKEAEESKVPDREADESPKDSETPKDLAEIEEEVKEKVKEATDTTDSLLKLLEEANLLDIGKKKEVKKEKSQSPPTEPEPVKELGSTLPEPLKGTESIVPQPLKEAGDLVEQKASSLTGENTCLPLEITVKELDEPLPKVTEEISVEIEEKKEPESTKGESPALEVTTIPEEVTVQEIQIISQKKEENQVVEEIPVKQELKTEVTEESVKEPSEKEKEVSSVEIEKEVPVISSPQPQIGPKEISVQLEEKAPSSPEVPLEVSVKEIEQEKESPEKIPVDVVQITDGKVEVPQETSVTETFLPISKEASVESVKAIQDYRESTEEEKITIIEQLPDEIQSSPEPHPFETQPSEAGLLVCAEISKPEAVEEPLAAVPEAILFETRADQSGRLVCDETRKESKIKEEDKERPKTIVSAEKEKLLVESNNNEFQKDSEKAPTMTSRKYFDRIPSDVPDLDKFQTENLKEADKDPNIPVGAPLFLEALQRHHPFLISESLTVDIHSGAISPVSPKQRSREKKKVTGGTGMKSPVMVSPGREHSMEVLIATKRGRPEFIPPGETVPDLDDPEARSRDRQKKAKEGVHRPEDDFQDKQDELEKIKKRVEMQRKMMDDLDKYRPKNIYKEEEDYGTEYDIDDSPWDSHYQIGPDTYLMASRGASFNSRVRDYRRELWGDGAPLVNQGYLGYRNRDITVRERRRYTDILREKQMNIDPKSSEKATSASKDPKANAVDRIKADIEKVAPTATKKNADGTFAPIFVRRLRDGYLLSNSLPAVFECTILSQPAAEVSWTKHGKQITNDDKHKIFQENGSYRLTIMDPSVYDLGEYSCVASNQYGQDKSSCRLVSGEAPNRPGRPDLQLSSDTELFFTFEPPEGPTYLEGIMYKVEYRLAGENDYGAPWVLISDKVDDEAVLIKHLEPLGIYQFRVTARNGFGWGEPSLNSRIVRTHPRGSPKLIMDELERTSRFCVVNMPQTKAGVQSLEEISEESEDTDEESLKKGISEVQLQESSFSGRFNIQSLIYQTKHSVIRNAQDNQSEGGANCVVKIRHCDGDSEAQSLKEYELLRKSQHENVVNLIAAHRCDGFLHIFMERLYEDVFARFTFNDNYTEEQICIVGRQLSAALHWLHFNGIAHLDVTPQNVLFISKRSWVLKLTDFSSAQSVGPEAKVPSEPNVQWAPPEYYVDSAPVTVQSDIWGMGVIVFCLLGGFHPFSSQFDTLDEVKENVINVKCDPNLIPVQASQEALSFVTWALKKSPIRRMRTDEALSHRFLSTDPSAVRRREAIRYPSSKLRKTAHLTKQSFETPTSSELSHKYGTLSNGSM